MNTPAIDLVTAILKPLPTYASVGCYPLFYLGESDAVLCADCANENRDELPSETAHPNWEDPLLHCDGCSSRIESAYAEPETMETENEL